MDTNFSYIPMKQYDNIDTFLRNATFQVDDNGFSDRVLQTLPKRAGWERRLQRIWQIICLTAALIIGWWTHALDIIMTDIKVFFHTLPLNYDMHELLLMSALPMLMLMVALTIWNKKIIY